jgi:hypothetical protein
MQRFGKHKMGSFHGSLSLSHCHHALFRREFVARMGKEAQGPFVQGFNFDHQLFFLPQVARRLLTTTDQGCSYTLSAAFFGYTQDTQNGSFLLLVGTNPHFRHAQDLAPLLLGYEDSILGLSQLTGR